ncbi:Fur family transcriptional regulator [Spiroplasma turonicum]|uniref:Fur family transcriptional regulator n=1 Tax=Spiroplasma turonicum TaxID=216946 RepID=A0A0K1P5D0_9MOLU|nr:transcriptional repressor [Spiroplasma turonicum]AKU79389.1 Fur family transcriptional regulator [Spiroplasma turonicum]ALX70410.1 Fur family transcriptional regulator [Spiroplasma turonicum]
MKNNIESYISYFKNKKIKITDVRMSMLKAITTMKHFTTPELISFVEKDLGTVNVMSIYNNIDLFLEHHLLFSNSIDGKQIVYEVLSKSLVHILCDTCGKIQDLEDDSFNLKCENTFVELLANSQNKLMHSKVELHVLCNECSILKKTDN